MNKSDLARHVAGETGMTRSAAKPAVNSMLVHARRYSRLGFGTLGTRSRPARMGPQSENRREPGDRSIHRGHLQAGQVFERFRERRRDLDRVWQ